MAVTLITSLAQLNAILDKSPSKLTVIDFYATWCGHCRLIARTYADLAKKYTNVTFLKCDVDETPEIPENYPIKFLPTFTFLKGRTKVDQVIGAKKAALENALRKHSSLAGSTPASAEAFDPYDGSSEAPASRWVGGTGSLN